MKLKRLCREVRLERNEAKRNEFVALALNEIERTNETALLSEPTLAVDWNRPEEDEAWAYLQPQR